MLQPKLSGIVSTDVALKVVLRPIMVSHIAYLKILHIVSRLSGSYTPTPTITSW